MIQQFHSEFTKLDNVVVEEPNKKEIIAEIERLDEQLVNAKNGKEAVEAVRAYFRLSDDLSTSFGLINIRHTIDTRNAYYKKLSDLIDEIGPEISEASNKFDKHFFDSPYRADLVKAFGQLYFDMVKQSMRTFSPKIVPDLVEENKLVSEYIDVVSSALIEFNGEKLSLSQMGKYTTSSDRETRAKASRLVWGFYADHDEQLGDIYGRMVKVRTKIAKTLGYPNFLPLAYDRMGRLDWTPEDAAQYRKKILDYIVPISNLIFAAQKKRLGYGDDTHFYDYAIFYKSGNPLPKGTPDQLVNAAERMYAEMSPIASEKFHFMVTHSCMNLLAKPGKAGGGYMDFLPSLKTSFIFANFNGTSGDVDVLTHEFGHALQGFLGAESTDVPSYRTPGMECAEMHSMSMEYLTYPWMNLFFKEDTEKYCYQHLCDALTFIPYGCIVDAFQTYAYEHPELTHHERKAYWRELEKTYLPHRTYEGNEFLASGGFWERQSHIFENPLYYLDYTIAQVVSLEFFNESRKNHQEALDKYIRFDKLGGTYPFRALLQNASIANPMDGDTLKNVAEEIVSYLDTFDPEALDR